MSTIIKRVCIVSSRSRCCSLNSPNSTAIYIKLSRCGIAGGWEETQKAHRARLEMMQQERIVDPNAKVKRFHLRALWTPMAMTYWVPVFFLFGCSIFAARYMTVEKQQERKDHMESLGYGDKARKRGPDGGTPSLTHRNQYIEEHINRVIAGEDPYKVAEELQQRHKEAQEIKTRMNRQNPATMPMTQSPIAMERQSKLKR
eukprot:CAMPEP_0202713504 /NCGR_PEP_ID=MMETSP1385-20130828/55340_1 /ASSEMBLY_ACC=CAM_ASM_000861 /TAXON_ID=933848 /ORGANISM="Elphidium margaritaceum" /LENGTH=200 /DNA_ID=CAMNT_0049373879 /DNA_START=33 /DNA_END=635 /DNA_ORIENTATION=-